MAEDRTEKATPKRKREARQKGQVAKSTEVNGALVLMAGVIGLSFMGPKIVTGTAQAMTAIFELVSHPNTVTSGVGMRALEKLVLHTIQTTAAPIAGMALAAGLLGNIAQVGLRPSMT